MLMLCFDPLARSSLLLALLLVCGCGTNKFEREVLREKSSVKLAREVVGGGYELLKWQTL